MQKSISGAVGGVIVRLGFLPQFPAGAFFIFGGTSAGAPQWAGISADLSQALGRPLGSINKRVYRQRALNAALFHDVTVGDNSWDDGVHVHFHPRGGTGRKRCRPSD